MLWSNCREGKCKEYKPKRNINACASRKLSVHTLKIPKIHHAKTTKIKMTDHKLLISQVLSELHLDMYRNGILLCLNNIKSQVQINVYGYQNKIITF